MVVAISRFLVVNGQEEAVAEAFRNRPRLVDEVPGFLGMETFTEGSQADAFYLVTRWTDEESYRVWHASPDHKLSHKGIPKGLKLDPKFTKVQVLDRIEEPSVPQAAAVADAAPFLDICLAQSERTVFARLSRDGRVLLANPAFRRWVGVDPQDRPLGELLDECSRLELMRGLDNPRAQRRQCLRLGELRCWLDVQPEFATLFGEPV